MIRYSPVLRDNHYAHARSTSRSGHARTHARVHASSRARRDQKSCNFYIPISRLFSITYEKIRANALKTQLGIFYTNRVIFTQYEKWKCFVFKHLRLAPRLQLAFASGSRERLTGTSGGGHKRITEGYNMPETQEQLLKRIAELEAMLKRKNTISFKVGEKGGVSAYGLGRFPVTLYREQWERLISAVPALQEFLKAHSSELSTKPAPGTTAVKA
jgi:hypothetical protein